MVKQVNGLVGRHSWRAGAPILFLMALALMGPFALDQRHLGAEALGPFPVGLAAGAVAITWQRFSAPTPRWGVVGLTSLILVVTLLNGGLAPVRAAAFTAATVLTSLVMTATMNWKGREAGLQGEAELGRFLAAVAAAGATNGLGYLLISVLSGAAQPFAVAAAGITSTVGSALFYLPFALPKPQRARRVSLRDRVTAWLALVICCVFVFTDISRTAHEFPYLVLPLLAWGAVRLTMWDLVWQLALVVTMASATGTSDRPGPLNPLASRLSSPDLGSFYLEIFLILCVVMTLTLAVVFHVRMLTGAQLHGEREQLAHIVRGATGLLVLGLDVHGTVRQFNAGATTMTGYRADEVVGRSPLFMLNPDDIDRHERSLGLGLGTRSRPALPQRFLSLVAAMAQLPEPRAFDWQLTCRDHGRRICSITFAPLTNAQGEIAGFIATGEDITDRVDAAEATRQALLAERAAVERLQEVDRVKDLLVSTVSHELRTPITNIMGYLEMMADGEFGDPTPAQRTAMSRMSLNSTRLMSLIDDLLTLSRVSSADFEVAAMPVDLRRLSEAVLSLVAPRAEAKDLIVTAQVPSTPIEVLGAPDELERVMLNLLTNAIKFTPATGQVALSVSTLGDQAVIDVRDTGIGIPVAEQSHLFEQFFRSSLSRELQIQGTGLGLSIVRTIVESHRGSIQVTSQPGVGSTFRVMLPLASADQGVPESPRSDVVAAAQPVTTTGPVTAPVTIPDVGVPLRRSPDRAW